ncbi:type III secretion protein HrpD [Erwinia amylovora Ea644]|uniref:hypothetical protein n=1 Tax=Erwinia amylovora TaxID=552 RepID=UPI0002C94446|nr:hypothetical protein [Erwinia amylovora]CCP01840.1 type III secretion protein HrpD [Erwinia amylovora Ea644]CCP05864.1 type III secretion protein HrpD [Erwinia amylovora MR1]
MSEMPAADDAALRWLRWWYIDCWLTADAQWRQASFYQLEDALLSALAHTHHAMICQQLQLATPLIPVDGDLLAWLKLTAPQRQLALRLAAEVCWRGSTQATLLPEQQRWCRRIAQGMRPGMWLPTLNGLPSDEGDINGLWLLKMRAGPQCWPRLRLSFPQEAVKALEQLAPIAEFPARLLPLWQAVFWYASQEPLC